MRQARRAAPLPQPGGRRQELGRHHRHREVPDSPGTDSIKSATLVTCNNHYKCKQTSDCTKALS